MKIFYKNGMKFLSFKQCFGILYLHIVFEFQDLNFTQRVFLQLFSDRTFFCEIWLFWRHFRLVLFFRMFSSLSLVLNAECDQKHNSNDCEYRYSDNHIKQGTRLGFWWIWTLFAINQKHRILWTLHKNWEIISKLSIFYPI